MVDKKVPRQKKKKKEMLTWNVIKWGVFFQIVSFVVNTLLQSVLQCLDPIGQKINQQQIWRHPMNCAANELFSPTTNAFLYLSFWCGF